MICAKAALAATARRRPQRGQDAHTRRSCRAPDSRGVGDEPCPPCAVSRADQEA
jgi:hypothetical protein